MVYVVRTGKPIDAFLIPPDAQLLTDSQEVEAVKEHFGNRPAVEGFGSFFVRVKDGDFFQVWGRCAGFPKDHSLCYPIKSHYRASPR